ncbi:MAG: hypothetical protein J3K34DRAFT_384117 [Monoraphidium minutum]|nr:MAG: hypothetical protein J3K34DRAFT_384117 [Monoraphidium minutum]
MRHSALLAALAALLLAARAPAPAAAKAAPGALLDAALALGPWITSVRRELHAIPELMFQEHKTSAAIKKHLDALGIPYKSYAKTGIVGRVGAGEPVVALRSDIDALPVVEPEGLEFRSTHDGRMHACGHDGHMSMLLGAAKLLKAREAQLGGTVLLVFQPAEEGAAGGDVMIKEGAIEGASAAFGMHVMPSVPSGSVALRRGTIMAGALSFEITVRGRGGHAALPHLNVDPVVAAASLVGVLQTLVSRETSPLGSAVLSVAMIQAGDTYNVIPDAVILGGTMRALTHEHMMYLKGRVEAMVSSHASSFGCNGTVDWRLDTQPYYPPLVNDDGAADFAWGVASKLLGSGKVFETEPIMPAEDFAFFARAVPSAFAFLGIRNETLGSVHNLHSRHFVLDEAALPRGAALHAALAMEYLAAGGVEGGAFGRVEAAAAAAAAHHEEL